jgi:hypothetical protein
MQGEDAPKGNGPLHTFPSEVRCLPFVASVYCCLPSIPSVHVCVAPGRDLRSPFLAAHMKHSETPSKRKHRTLSQVLSVILEKGGPRLWAKLSCLNKHWKRVAEEFAATKMIAEPRMERIPLKIRCGSIVQQRVLGSETAKRW